MKKNPNLTNSNFQALSKLSFSQTPVNMLFFFFGFLPDALNFFGSSNMIFFFSPSFLCKNLTHAPFNSKILYVSPKLIGGDYDIVFINIAELYVLELFPFDIPCKLTFGPTLIICNGYVGRYVFFFFLLIGKIGERKDG